MGKTILFSPVGGTDPVSMDNVHDGSLIHICRVYKPDVVYLYMSKEILDNHNKDNRYLFCLDKLSEQINHKMDYIIIEKPELSEVQRFDIIYADITKEVKDIVSKMDSDDKLLLNVSSGTPQMKSSLTVMNVLGEFPFTAIQVSTPEKGMNEHTHKDYSEFVEILWEDNQDNCDDFINRCSEVECPALLVDKRNEIIKKHVLEYDYSGALNTMGMVAVDDKDIRSYLELANYRTLLDFKSVDNLQRQLKIDVTPQKSSDIRKIFEYALVLQIKQKKGLYSDFLRGITPLLVDLFTVILRDKCGIKNIEKYYKKDKKTGGIRWDNSKLEGDEIGKEILECFNNEYGEFGYSYVCSDNLVKIIGIRATDQKIKEVTDDLRDVEVRIRNLAAHQIVSIDEDRIEKETGFSSQRILKLIKQAFNFTSFGVNQKDWDSYDEMNEDIIKLIS